MYYYLFHLFMYKCLNIYKNIVNLNSTQIQRKLTKKLLGKIYVKNRAHWAGDNREIREDQLEMGDNSMDCVNINMIIY